MTNNHRYARAVAYLEGLSNLPMEKDYMQDRSTPQIFLDRMEYFLHALGNPEKGFQYIHVTGTAGKGTVTTMVHNMLHADGKRVGSYTSPFVTTSIEKICVNDLYIAPDEFADIVDELKPVIDEMYLASPFGKPSYFEIFLATALVYFKKQQCEWVVLEVGAGGRYDATNFIASPVATVITNIDYDHTQLLGKTLQKIARDKAGIIKPGSLFFTSEQRPVLLKMFRDVCKEKGATFHHVSHRQSFQEYNESLVLDVGHGLGIDEAIVKKAIESTHLQCRFEVVQEQPLVVVDGAHNRIKIQSTIEHLRERQFKKLFLIIGIADNKDHLAMLEQIVPLADSVFFTRFQMGSRPCASPKKLFALSQKYMKASATSRILLDPMCALQIALKDAGPEDCILVTGSFFLAGDLRQHWIPEETILQNRRSR